jgi:Ca2+-binding EF-hand superfamily protein
MKANHFQAVFRAIDSDGSGMITKKELKILLEKYKVQANTEEINMMIEVCSQDGKGFIHNFIRSRSKIWVL